MKSLFQKNDDVIIALEKPTPERVMSLIVAINGAPSSIKILPDMYEVVTGLARTTQLVGVPLIDVNLNIDTFYTRKLKRLLESIVASFESGFMFTILDYYCCNN